MIPTRANIECYQQTSLQAYVNLIPRLGARRAAVYEVLKRCGAMTNAETSRLLGLPINCITGRTRELVKAGLVEKKITDTCSVTGNTAIRWGVV